MRLLLASVFFLVLGAACLALAIASLPGGVHHTHWRLVSILAAGGVVLGIVGGRLLAKAIAQKKNSCR